MLQEMLDEYPGKPFTAKEIAEYVGVDPSRIKQIERDALKKLGKDEELWDVWNEVSNSSQDKKSQTLSE